MPRVRHSVLLLLLLASATGACARSAEPEPLREPGAVATPPPRPTAPPAPDRSAFVAEVDALAADALARGPIAGLSIAVVERGRPVVARGYGFTDLSAGTLAAAETSYPIASVSKLFTAAAILRLADKGQLSLDDPLSRFFPDARQKIGALTLRHLLDHTSGLTKGGPAPREAATSVLRRGGTARDQGLTWNYSNYNFSLLGLVLEQVTGRDYAAYVHEEFVAPLGLTGTGYCEDGAAIPGRGRDYLSGARLPIATDYWQKPHFFAAGGLCSTVLDLVRFQKALDEGRLLSPASLQAMRTPTVLPGALEADYGLGTRMGNTGTHRKLGHTGGGQGNKAVLARYPDDDVTIVVLLNTERAGGIVTANGLEEQVAQRLFGPRVAGAPDENLRTYAGEYRDAGGVVHVAAVSDGLTVRPGLRHRTASQYLAAGKGTFVAAEDPTVELRFRDHDSQVLGYARYRNGWFTGVAVRAPEGLPSRSAPVRGR